MKQMLCCVALVALMPLVASFVTQEQDTVASLKKELDQAHQDRKFEEGDLGKQLLERSLKVAERAPEAEQLAAWRLVLDVIGKAGLRGPEVDAPKRAAVEGICKVARDDAENLVPLITSQMSDKRYADLRKDLLEHSRSDSVKGACLAAQGAELVKEMYDGVANEDERLAAIAALERCAREFGKEKDYGRYENWAAAVEGPLFQLQNLYVGALAPDIEGEDLNGVKFKLSDYRGKVVVLDFWGNW